jgi:hypothetical protein
MEGQPNGRDHGKAERRADHAPGVSRQASVLADGSVSIGAGVRVLVCQIDGGKLPNLALMRIMAAHRAQGDEVVFTRTTRRDLLDGHFDRVYGSVIFSTSIDKVNRLRQSYPDAIIGGSGVADLPDATAADKMRVEDLFPGVNARTWDYTPWPEYSPSIGFTSRGCRLACKFCGVPGREGKPVPVHSISDIWRGAGHAKKLHLLDNDFFGQGEYAWRSRADEIIEGDFKVSLNQGINVRFLAASNKVSEREAQLAAETLVAMDPRNAKFNERLIYMAWDNLKDEEIFFAGVDRLEAAGWPPNKIMSYMLVGWDKSETWDRIWYRFERMVARGIEPFPMPFHELRIRDPDHWRDLKRFQRWTVRGLYRARNPDGTRAKPFDQYDANIKTAKIEERRREAERQPSFL